MAEVLGVITGLYTAGQALQTFAHQIHKWRHVSERLFDIREGLDVVKVTLESWQYKYDIQAHRPDLHMRILFGKEGFERIQATLGSISIVARTIESDIDRVKGQALKVRTPGDPNDSANEEVVKDCLRRIQRNTTWSRKFKLSVLGKADDLEMRLERLHRKLNALERFSDSYLEQEHPYIFAEVKRLPGRRFIFKVGNGRMDTVQSKLLGALAARKDAELLHRATGKGNQVHIGLSVPQIHKRDFAFLLSLNGRTYEVLVHPVKIKAVNDPLRVQTSFLTAVPALIRNTHEACYMLPSSSTSAGFQVSIPPASLLSDLECKDALSTIVRQQNTRLGSQILYPQDQCAIASGIAQGCFRLIGSQWLTFLDCTNVRWRRTKEGKWTSMLTAAPGTAAVTRSLDKCLVANRQRRDSRDLSKHMHIFRIGLVLAELALKSPILYIDFDDSTNMTKLFINDGEEVDAGEVAAQVDLKSNVFLGNMVFFCLNVLQNRDAMADKSIEGAYFQDVLKQAEELDGLIRADKRRGGVSPGGSGMSTPRNGGSYVF
ncbi:hypothetical protein EJ02DRAFT_393611 [Clathrospora elynae]|uniref:Uncharacterized protein n=1 Tax=Clathrospora elynae TaxID=706981 RepID=A0A6A5T792_9PLEO|nr:hypothetical protein EJ02DRAFT_393611 [Clathrospora elynae]